MNWKIGIDIYTLICIKQITNKNLLYKKIKLKKPPKQTKKTPKKPKMKMSWIQSAIFKQELQTPV